MGMDTICMDDSVIHGLLKPQNLLNVEKERHIPIHVSFRSVCHLVESII